MLIPVLKGTFDDIVKEHPEYDEEEIGDVFEKSQFNIQ